MPAKLLSSACTLQREQIGDDRSFLNTAVFSSALQHQKIHSCVSARRIYLHLRSTRKRRGSSGCSPKPNMFRDYGKMDLEPLLRTGEKFAELYRNLLINMGLAMLEILSAPEATAFCRKSICCRYFAKPCFGTRES